MKSIKNIDLSKPTFTLDGKLYYVKECDKYTLGIELVVERLAEMVGIKCANYRLIKKDGKYYYLSEEIPSFMTADRFTAYSNNLLELLDYINDNYPNQSSRVIDEVIKIFLFDILLINGDRNSHNWGFTNNNDEINACILDNSYAFYGTEKVKLAFNEDSYEINIGINNEIISNNVKELIYLLDTSSVLYYDVLFDMLDILTPSAVMNVFKAVENYYNINIPNKEKLLGGYRTNYNIINELVRGRNL